MSRLSLLYLSSLHPVAVEIRILTAMARAPGPGRRDPFCESRQSRIRGDVNKS